MATVVDMGYDSFHEIKITQPGESWLGTRVFADGEQIHGVTALEYNVCMDEVPEISVTIIPKRVDVDLLGRLNLRVDVDDYDTALRCAELALRLNRDLRDRVCESIEDVLHEWDVPTNEAKEMSLEILDSIFTE